MVTTPSEAIEIASVSLALPIVPASLIMISSAKVTIPPEEICIAAVEDAEPILPSSGTITPPSAESVIVVAEIAPLNIALPASLISSVRAVISEVLSVPLKMMSASPACASIVMLPEVVAILTAPSPAAMSSAAGFDPPASSPTNFPDEESYFRNLPLTVAVDLSTSSRNSSRTSPPPPGLENPTL